MSQELTWDGCIRAEGRADDDLRRRHALADAARDYRWPDMLEILAAQGDLINAARPDGKTGFAPLHQAANGNAPAEVIGALLRVGAWRTLQNARGERAVDVAERQGHARLVPLLAPVFPRQVPAGILLRIQANFHAVIRGRAQQQVDEWGLRLPELEPLLEYRAAKCWFGVPGMYGGFAYWLERDGVQATLVSESWCRVVGGSGERHEVDSAGSRLVAQGFV